MSYVHWNSPPEILNPIRDMCGQVYLDPCSNETSIVNPEIVAPFADGLSYSWTWVTPNGRAIFVNPPYSRDDNAVWAEKWAHEASKLGPHLFGLVQASPGSAWFRQYMQACDAVCFPDQRLKFLRDGKPVAGANFGNALFYAGPAKEQFALHFEHLGSILYR